MTFKDFLNLNLDALDSGEEAIYLRTISDDFPVCVTFSEDINAAFFVRCGTLYSKINGKEMRIGKGELFLVSPNDFLEFLIPDRDYEGRSILVSNKRMLELINDVELYRYMVYLKESPIINLPADNENLINTYLDLIDYKLEHAEKSNRSLMAVNYLLHNLVIEVSEALTLIDKSVSAPRNNIFKRFMELLNTISIHNHTVEWYASQLNVTPKHLSAVCRKSSGRSASAWIKEYSIIDIKKSLRDNSMSIKEVAFALGYPNLSFFGKCVRRWFGMSPTALRAKLC